MPSQWLGGKRPKGIAPTPILVIGPENFDDKNLLWRKLDVITFWMDDVELHTRSISKRENREERGGEWYWTGASHFALLWADKHWFDRCIYHPTGTSYAACDRRDRNMLEKCPKNGLFIAFWDRQCQTTATLIELAELYFPADQIRIIKYRS